MSPWISNFIRFRIYMYWASLLATIFIYISFSFIMHSVENFLAIKYFRWMDGLLFLQLSCRTIPILLWIEPIVHLHYICKQCISFRYWFVILCTRTENRRHFSLQFKYLLQNNASIFFIGLFFFIDWSWWLQAELIRNFVQSFAYLKSSRSIYIRFPFDGLANRTTWFFFLQNPQWVRALRSQDTQNDNSMSRTMSRQHMLIFWTLILIASFYTFQK